jgi:DNA-binding NarL/FixJ family response regulator
MAKKPIRVLLADDDASVREAVRSLLESHGDLKVVGCAADGKDAALLASQLVLDVAILDIAMPKADGIGVARHIRRIAPQTRIVILSAHTSSAHLNAALLAGAHGFVDKAALGIDLIAAVRAVMAGERYLSASLKNS